MKVMLYINLHSFILPGFQNGDECFMVVTVKYFNFGFSKSGVIFKASLKVLPLAPSLAHPDSFLLASVEFCIQLPCRIWIFISFNSSILSISWMLPSSVFKCKTLWFRGIAISIFLPFISKVFWLYPTAEPTKCCFHCNWNPVFG